MTSNAAREGEASRFFGDYSEKVTPVPIPNTVVKLLCADNTWRATAREHKSSPELTFGSRNKISALGRFFSKRIYSSIAQSVEHAAVNRRVVGSSPTGGAKWLRGQAVKTPPFHGGNRGSSPLGVTLLLLTHGVEFMGL